VAKELVY